MKDLLRACVHRVAALFDHGKGQELDTVSAEEIGNAVRMLYGTHTTRRKRQRKRRHVTYKQRDAIAWLLIRLQHERKEHRQMNRTDWVNQFTQYIGNMSEFNAQEIADAAEAKASEQNERTGTDDAAMWQAPGAAAQAQMNEWNREAEEAGESGTPPEVEPQPGAAQPQTTGDAIAENGEWLPPKDTGPTGPGQSEA